MITQEASEKLQGILSRMGVTADVEAREDGDRVVLEIKGPETALLIGKHGATLDALQYLVQRMMLGKAAQNAAAGLPAPEGGSKLIVVDAEGYRDRREEALVDLAKRLAAKAKKTRRPVPATPMSPADRRVMHMALANEPGLRTESEGEGASRHLVIVPDPNFDFGPLED